MSSQQSTIIITISGRPGVGKSAIAQQVGEVLQDFGFNVHLDETSVDYRGDEDIFDNALSHVARVNPKIVIQEQSTPIEEWRD